MKKFLLVTAAVAVCLSVLGGCHTAMNSAPADGEGAFACYDNLPTAKGLELYVRKTADGEYQCSLMAGTNRSKTAEEIAALPAATAEEMKTILAAYELPAESITVIPTSLPEDQAPWELDAAELQELRELFGVPSVVDTVQAYEAAGRGFYDSIYADIDNDGTQELCTLGYGSTSGLFSFTITASTDGVQKYANTYCTEWYDLSFTERDGRVCVQAVAQGGELQLFSIAVENGNIVLSENGEKIGG